MARGSVAKEIVAKKLLETFEGSFAYEKEIRIPIVENGEIIQIKVTLTAAKTNVEQGEENAVPGTITIKNPEALTQMKVEPTAEEKENVRKLLASLNL